MYLNEALSEGPTSSGSNWESRERPKRLEPAEPPNEGLLKRLLYLCTIKELKYCCGGPKYAVKSTVEEVINHFFLGEINYQKFLDIVTLASKDPLLPNRSQIFYVLAKGFCSADIIPEVKAKLCQTVVCVSKSDRDFFDFIQHISELRKDKKTKIPHSVCKAVRTYYLNKSPKDLVQSLSITRSYHRWAHKDLLNLAHIKARRPEHVALLDYLYNKNVEGVRNVNIKCLIEKMKMAAQLRKETDVEQSVSLIKILKPTSFQQVHSTIHKKAEIWAEMIPNLPILELMQALPKLYRWGFLKRNTVTLTRMLEALSDKERIKAENIHPMDVFIYLRNFEKGGRPLDPRLIAHLRNRGPKLPTQEEIEQTIKRPYPIKCSTISNQLIRCMSLACENVKPLDKRILITVDTTDKMDTPCLRYKNITGTEMAAAFVWYMKRLEKDVTVAVFSEKTISVLDFETNAEMKVYIEKFRLNRSKYLTFPSPVIWANGQEKSFDVFLNIIQHHKSHSAIPKEEKDNVPKLEEALQQYKTKMNLPDTKLVTVCAYSRHLLVNGNTVPSMFDIAGLDLGVPRIVEAFCRNVFS